MIDFLGPRVHTTHFCVTTPFSAVFPFFLFFFFLFNPAMTRNAFQVSSGLLSKFDQIHKLHHHLLAKTSLQSCCQSFVQTAGSIRLAENHLVQMNF